MENNELRAVDQSGSQVVSSQSVAANPWTGMIEASLANNVDISTFERLVELQRQEEDRQAERAFNAALSSLQGSIPEVSKAGVANFKTKGGGSMAYNFDQLSDICNALKGLLGENGLSYSWDFKQEGQMRTVRCTMYHSSGHSRACQMTAPPDTSGMKNQLQAISSTNSYLQRYTLKAVAGISSVDDDGHASSKKTKDGVKFARWMATAKQVMRTKEGDELETYYRKAITYAATHSPAFVTEIHSEHKKLTARVEH